MKEFDNKSRSGIRKTVNLSKTHTRRGDDDDEDEEEIQERVKVFQTKSNKSKSTHSKIIQRKILLLGLGKRSPSFDDDIEEELNQGNFKSSLFCFV